MTARVARLKRQDKLLAYVVAELKRTRYALACATPHQKNRTALVRRVRTLRRIVR